MADKAKAKAPDLDALIAEIEALLRVGVGPGRTPNDELFDDGVKAALDVLRSHQS
jgi:GTP cyclohydrolase III